MPHSRVQGGRGRISLAINGAATHCQRGSSGTSSGIDPVNRVSDTLGAVFRVDAIYSIPADGTALQNAMTEMLLCLSDGVPRQHRV
jgi:hypothetical protein